MRSFWILAYVTHYPKGWLFPFSSLGYIRSVLDKSIGGVILVLKNSQNSILVGGIPTPLKNMKVSWDDYSQYMESHKIHVPNHQPVIENPREFWVTYCQNNTILSIFCGTVFWIYSKRSTFWGSPTKQGILHQFNGVGLDPRYSKLSFSSWVWYIPNYRNTDWRSVSEFYYVLSIQMACPQVRHP